MQGSPCDTQVIPRDVAICPYCGCTLSVEVVGETLDEITGLWLADMIMVQFGSEPPMEPDDDWPDQISLEWQEWVRAHSVMPYVYMLPLEEEILDWINTQRYPVSPGRDIPCPHTLDLFEPTEAE